MLHHFCIDFCSFLELEIYPPNYCLRLAEVIWLKNYDCDADMSKAVWVKNYGIRMDFWAECLETDGGLGLKCACLDELAAVRWVLFLGASLPVTRPLSPFLSVGILS